MPTGVRDDVIVEDVDMDDSQYDDSIKDVDVVGLDAEVETFLLQVKLQMDERDAAGVTMVFESFTSVLVQCFVPLLEQSSMLPIVPMVHLRVAELDHAYLVEVLSNTHIYVPHELITKSTTGSTSTYHVNLPLLQTPLKQDFVRVAPKLVTEFIKQMHSFDPQPPPPPIPSAAQSPPSRRRPSPAVVLPSDCTLFPLAHVPGTLFHGNDVTGAVVTAILVGVTPSSLYILHPGPTHHQHDLAAVHQVIPLKDIARVVLKRGANQSFVLHFKAPGTPCKPIFSQNSERIVATVEANMENHNSTKRRLEQSAREHDDPRRPRLAKRSSGFDMSSFFSNVEKVTKEMSQKVVGSFNEVSKLLSGEAPPLTLVAISQMEAHFFRRPSPAQLFAITEGYKTVVQLHARQKVDASDDVADQAETNLLTFVRQPQVQRVLHSTT
ncbi:hypothetical protein, variant 1 [Aphanomyces astaci]|uniref:Uncharacterized protein n=1 Tax=Aphanomyces astaci TaxID=112090 RepID=W4HA50_APHAT|nr:hypothetical protein, variant 1 [Aphanomyces astaci]ETV87988.1 hypothetical protein, variant 1 [Aphanomyces astaci]|eukprot:XP_009822851.1 hypothetical protein, variant 1 [Aphanomyces astaci]